MQFIKRTMMCGELNSTHEGLEVVLNGWVRRNRRLGGVNFVQLRDRSGVVQLVFNDKTEQAVFDMSESLKGEYVIAVKGIVGLRLPENINKEIATGEIEVFVTELQILNTAETPPFYIEENADANETLRLKYRYLDLRRPDMQHKIMMRHRVSSIARDYFYKNGFLEIETPMLIRSTPEGARDYVVPSRIHPGSYYALPQSPQLYKQLLMVAGYDRYMQIVKCFRDEDLRADRQPEFTQIDLEASFVDADDIISINEGFIKRVFKEVLDADIQTPFLRMPYTEAMERFGSDKPDTRFAMELCDLSEELKDSEFKVFSGAVSRGGSVRCINAKGLGKQLGRKVLDDLTEYVKMYKSKGLAWIVKEEEGLRSQITKFLTENEVNSILDKAGAEIGDVVLIVADTDEIVFDALGNLRLEIARRFGLIDESRFDFLWVVDFPLFEYSDGRYAAKHHPFTSPMDEDIPLLEAGEYGNVRAKAYDVVLNGTEVGGGSIRIFNRGLQELMFKALGLDSETANEKFGFLLEAFKYGAPPHGGMAYGLDRLCMLMSGSESIRDVIAFPKVQSASELMTDAPNVIDVEQLKELGILK